MSKTTPDTLRTLEIPVRGMDCTECTEAVQHALCTLAGVEEAQVYLSSEKAVVRYDPAQVDLEALHRAVASAGYTVVPEGTGAAENAPSASSLQSFTHPILTLFSLVFRPVLLLAVFSEELGAFERLTHP